MTTILSVDNLSKSYGDQVVISNFSFKLEEGEIVAILGQSGTGKTTFMRLINHLENLDQGTLVIGDAYLVKGGVYVDKKEQRRYHNQLGMVFQDFQLFPHLTVLENLIEAPLAQGLAGLDELNKQAVRLLEKVGLGDKLTDLPSYLSGGQKQRVAIARAMMLNPKVLCFDEPTSALDKEAAQQIGQMIQQLAAEGSAVIIITHDEDFAYQFAQRIVHSSSFIDQAKDGVS